MHNLQSLCGYGGQAFQNRDDGRGFSQYLTTCSSHLSALYFALGSRPVLVSKVANYFRKEWTGSKHQNSGFGNTSPNSDKHHISPQNATT